MAVATPFKTPVSMTDAEREARVNLAALHRLTEHYGWEIGRAHV